MPTWHKRHMESPKQGNVVRFQFLESFDVLNGDILRVLRAAPVYVPGFIHIRVERRVSPVFLSVESKHFLVEKEYALRPQQTYKKIEHHMRDRSTLLPPLDYQPINPHISHCHPSNFISKLFYLGLSTFSFS